MLCFFFFFFKQKTAYEMRISDWSSDVCSSDLFPHQNFVSIRICRSSLNRDLSNDWHYGKDQMMEVNMSEAQWATFVSSMNVGSGTPCTLASVDGQPVPGLTLPTKTAKSTK